mmetsp:Transcript_1291/g.5135  ORF Transcript_1291/g.5135 Transcript_1291/m.5135 type:complete len:250 (-) Transcript_1291:41-790(-)
MRVNATLGQQLHLRGCFRRKWGATSARAAKRGISVCRLSPLALATRCRSQLLLVRPCRHGPGWACNRRHSCSRRAVRCQLASPHAVPLMLVKDSLLFASAWPKRPLLASSRGLPAKGSPLLSGALREAPRGDDQCLHRAVCAVFRHDGCEPCIDDDPHEREHARVSDGTEHGRLPPEHFCHHRHSFREVKRLDGHSCAVKRPAVHMPERTMANLLFEPHVFHCQVAARQQQPGEQARPPTLALSFLVGQ